MNKILLICLFGVQVFQSHGQENPFLRGKIIDSNTGRPVSFASLKLKSNDRFLGVVSNIDGDFQIPVKYKAISDSLIISCIGYQTKKISIKQLSDDHVSEVKLMESVQQLLDIVVRAKKPGRITTETILRKAIEAIPKNCETQPYSYVAYYRDYQIKDSAYINLNEAIVEIFDKGLNKNDQITTQMKLLSYSTNKEFQRDSTTEVIYDNENKFIQNATLFPFGGNELSILRVHDAIRNYNQFSFSYINVLSIDFINNHFLNLEKTIYLNALPLYHISFRTRPSITGYGHYAKGDIYIEQGNFAIHKIEYFTYEGKPSEGKLLYNVQLEYSRAETLMHLNYISFNDLFKLKNPQDFKVTDVLFDRIMNVFIVTFNHIPDRQSALNEKNYNFKLENKSLEIDKIERSFNRENQVWVYIQKEDIPSNIVENELKKLMKNLKAEFKGIKDIDGREVNETTYIPVNQFRELFVQARTLNAFQSGDTLYIRKNEPLHRSYTSSQSDNEIAMYWMNTPLKKNDP